MGKKHTEVGAFEAKTRLAQLLREAERGHPCTIFRRGKPVARLLPIEPDDNALNADELIDAFRAIRGGIKGTVDVVGLVEDGRRY